MIKVKTFITNSNNKLHHEQLDNAINHFLEENDVEVIDIKYSTATTYNGVGIVWTPSALLIYKAKN